MQSQTALLTNEGACEKHFNAVLGEGNVGLHKKNKNYPALYITDFTHNITS